MLVLLRCIVIRCCRRNSQVTKKEIFKFLQASFSFTLAECSSETGGNEIDRDDLATDNGNRKLNVFIDSDNHPLSTKILKLKLKRSQNFQNSIFLYETHNSLLIPFCS